MATLTGCSNCDRTYDLPTKPGTYRCTVCGREYRISANIAPTISPVVFDISLQSAYASDQPGSGQPQVTHHCPNCEAMTKEREALHALCDKQADILSRVAIALRGPEPPQTKWSHHDLPERAAKIKQEIAHLRAGILRVIDDYPRDIKQDAEEALRALLAETEGK